MQIYTEGSLLSGCWLKEYSHTNLDQPIMVHTWPPLPFFLFHFVD